MSEATKLPKEQSELAMAEVSAENLPFAIERQAAAGEAPYNLLPPARGRSWLYFFSDAFVTLSEPHLNVRKLTFCSSLMCRCSGGRCGGAGL